MPVGILRQSKTASTARTVARTTARMLLLAGAMLFVGLFGAQAHDGRVLLQQAARAGPRALKAVEELQPLLASLGSKGAAMQLEAINHFFNSHIEFATDRQTWGQEDYWASPLQSLAKGSGDCEDYAIAKYFSLLAVGVPVSRLRLVYVRARLDNGTAQPHMVLAYYPAAGTEVQVLDNLIDSVLPASRRSDLTPIFSFNSDGLWQGIGAVGAGDPLARLSRWREVLARARSEGFL